MKHSFLLTLAIVVLGLTAVRAEDSEEGFTPIFDGKTFTGWQTSIDNTNTWQIEDALSTTVWKTGVSLSTYARRNS